MQTKIAVAAVSLAWPLVTFGQIDSDPSSSPPQLRPEIAAALGAASACIGNDDYSCASAELDAVSTRSDLSEAEVAEIAYATAYLSYKLGRLDDALSEFESLIAQPGESEVHLQLARYASGQILAMQERYAEARTRLDEWFEHAGNAGFEQRVGALFVSAAVNFKLGQTDAAVGDYDSVIIRLDVTDPRRQQSLYTTSQMLATDGRYDEALERFDEWLANEDEPRAEAQMMHAWLEKSAGRAGDASRSASLAIELAWREGRDIPQSWYELDVMASLEFGGCTEAYQALEEMLQLWPEQRNYERLAGCAGEVGDTDREVELYDVMARSGWLDARGDLRYAWLLLDAHRYEDAQTALGEGLDRLDSEDRVGARAVTDSRF